ncbi:MAG: hypothetical protein LUC95_03905 [Lachnospiraceae bacterium]|nr:hypothetical protein [Lachnospiraceae bacterium]
MILILLTILKIIGITLLVLLGLLLLLLCLLMFAPVKYRTKGAKHPDELSVSAFVSYLWPLVRVRVKYPTDEVLSVKILWIDLLHPKEKKAKKSGKKRKAGKRPDKRQKQNKQEKVTDKPLRTVTQESAECKIYQDIALDSQDTATIDKSIADDIESPADHCYDHKKSTQTMIAHSAGKSRGFDSAPGHSEHKNADKKVSQKAKSVSHTGKDSENRLVAIAALLYQYKEMYPDVLSCVFHALKSILPRKCNIHLIFGTGSPDSTGYLYGAYCALQEYLPGKIAFEPVWMESYLDVEFELCGKIRLIHFVTAAVKLIADKRVRKFISEIRRL